MVLNTAISSFLPTPEIEDFSCSSLLLSAQISVGCILHDSISFYILSSSLNENSYTKSMPNNITMSHKSAPVQKN